MLAAAAGSRIQLAAVAQLGCASARPRRLQAQKIQPCRPFTNSDNIWKNTKYILLHILSDCIILLIIRILIFITRTKNSI